MVGCRLVHAYQPRQVVPLHCLGQLQQGQDFDCHGVVLGVGHKQPAGDLLLFSLTPRDQVCMRSSMFKLVAWMLCRLKLDV